MENQRFIKLMENFIGTFKDTYYINTFQTAYRKWYQAWEDSKSYPIDHENPILLQVFGDLTEPILRLSIFLEELSKKIYTEKDRKEMVSFISSKAFFYNSYFYDMKFPHKMFYFITWFVQLLETVEKKLSSLSLDTIPNYRIGFQRIDSTILYEANYEIKQKLSEWTSAFFVSHNVSKMIELLIQERSFNLLPFHQWKKKMEKIETSFLKFLWQPGDIYSLCLLHHLTGLPSIGKSLAQYGKRMYSRENWELICESESERLYHCPFLPHPSHFVYEKIIEKSLTWADRIQCLVIGDLVLQPSETMEVFQKGLPKPVDEVVVDSPNSYSLQRDDLYHATHVFLGSKKNRKSRKRKRHPTRIEKVLQRRERQRMIRTKKRCYSRNRTDKYEMALSLINGADLIETDLDGSDDDYDFDEDCSICTRSTHSYGFEYDIVGYDDDLY